MRRIASILAATLSVFVFIPLSVHADTYPGSNGRIGYADGTTNYGSTVNADGTGATAINSISTVSVAYSPDGSKIVYSGPYGNLDLFVADADGSNAVNITNNPSANNEYASWSPDGSKIIFDTAADHHIYTIKPDGSDVTQITSGGSDQIASFSPDGTKIVFERYITDYGYDIFTANADGTNVTDVAANPEHEVEPRWSPDGSKIVYSKFDGSNYEIWVMDADGNNQTQLTNGSNSLLSPVFSPDGTKIAFSLFNNNDSHSYLYTMNTDGTNAALLMANPIGEMLYWHAIPANSSAGQTADNSAAAPATTAGTLAGTGDNSGLYVLIGTTLLVFSGILRIDRHTKLKRGLQ